MLEREVAYNPKTGALTFWTSSVDPETFESDMQRLNLITDIQQWNNQVSGRTLYYACLPASETTYWERVGQEGMLLGGQARNGDWIVRTRFPNREALVEFRTECKNRDIEFSLKTLTRGDDSPNEGISSMTEAQRSLLTMAVEQDTSKCLAKSHCRKSPTTSISLIRRRPSVFDAGLQTHSKTELNNQRKPAHCPIRHYMRLIRGFM